METETAAKHAPTVPETGRTRLSAAAAGEAAERSTLNIQRPTLKADAGSALIAQEALQLPRGKGRKRG